MSENNSNETAVVISQGIGSLQVSETAVFGQNLRRSNTQIKKDRSDEITRSTYVKYKRAVEDLDEELYRLLSKRANMLDLSPANAQSLLPANNFDSGDYLINDIDLSKQIREKTIIANITRSRCNYLFATTYDKLPLEE